LLSDAIYLIINPLSLFFKDLFHRFRVDGLHGGKTQALDHVQRALLVLLEVIGLQVPLVGSISE